MRGHNVKMSGLHRILIGALLASTSVSVHATPCLNLVGENPWVWWSLDETDGSPLKDQSGNNNTATTPPNGSMSGPAMVHNGREFDAVDDYIEVPSSPSLNFGKGNLTAMAWVLPVAAERAVYTILDKRQASPGYLGYSFFQYRGRLGLQLATGAGGTGFANYVVVGPVIPMDQEFHHVAVTVDRLAADGIKFYLDGMMIGAPFNPTNQPGSLDTTAPLRIGSVAFATQNLFSGMIDEVMLFPRALSAAEIGAIFAAKDGGLCPQCITYVNDYQRYQSLTAGLSKVMEDYQTDSSGAMIPTLPAPIMKPGNFFQNANRMTYTTVGVSSQNFPFGSLTPFLGKQLGFVQLERGNPNYATVKSFAGLGNATGYDGIQAKFSSPVSAAGYGATISDPDWRFILHRLDATGTIRNTYPVQGSQNNTFFSLVSPPGCSERISAVRISPVSGQPWSIMSPYGTFRWTLFNTFFAY